MLKTLRKWLLIEITNNQNGGYLVDYLVYYGLSLIAGYLMLADNDALTLNKIALFSLVTFVVSLPMIKIKKWLADKLAMDNSPFFQITNSRQEKWAKSQNEAGLSLMVSLSFILVNMMINHFLLTIV